jgi:hypothetical protein
MMYKLGVFVSIEFYGDELDPEELTRLLGSEPSWSSKVGERRKLSNGETQIMDHGKWLIDYGKEISSVIVEEQIASLLDKMTDDPAIWHDLTSRYDTRVSCGIYINSFNEKFELSEAILKRLSDRHLKISMDIFSYDISE